MTCGSCIIKLFPIPPSWCSSNDWNDPNDYDFDVTALRECRLMTHGLQSKKSNQKIGCKYRINMAASSLQNSCLKTDLCVVFILLFFGYFYHRLVLGIMSNNFSGITGNFKS